MSRYAIGDSIHNNTVFEADASKRLDFTCQVGDTHLTPVLEQTPASMLTGELTGMKDFQCQAKGQTSDVECQAKHATRNVHCQSRSRLSDAHGQSTLLDNAATLELLMKRLETIGGHVRVASASRFVPKANHEAADNFSGETPNTTPSGVNDTDEKRGTDVECQSDFEGVPRAKSPDLDSSTSSERKTEGDAADSSEVEKKPPKEVKHSGSQCDPVVKAKSSHVSSQTKSGEMACHAQTQVDTAQSDFRFEPESDESE